MNTVIFQLLQSTYIQTPEKYSINNVINLDNENVELKQLSRERQEPGVSS